MDQDTFIRACRDGGRSLEQALRRMHADYAGALLREAWLALRDEAAAHDVLQEALIKAWRRCATFEARSQLFPWLKGIVRRTAIDRQRRMRPEGPLEDDDGRPLPGVEAALAQTRPTADPAAWAERAEAEAVFRRCAEHFAAEQPRAAEVIRWVVEDGLKPADIAPLIGRSEGATRTYLGECRKKARRYFADWYRLAAAPAGRPEETA
jgi:RNA polymerase sigma factor (sigma-70 family)